MKSLFWQHVFQPFLEHFRTLVGFFIFFSVTPPSPTHQSYITRSNASRFCHDVISAYKPARDCIRHTFHLNVTDIKNMCIEDLMVNYYKNLIHVWGWDRKSVPRITVWYHTACWVMPKRDRDGQSFLSSTQGCVNFVHVCRLAWDWASIPQKLQNIIISIPHFLIIYWIKQTKIWRLFFLFGL